MGSTALAYTPHPTQPNPQPPETEGLAGDALTLAELAHDARSLVTAMRLCANLIGEPGVLQPQHSHYAEEIAVMAEASAELMQKLGTLARAGQPREVAPVEIPVTDLARELRQMGGLLSAMAGPRNVVQIACLPCAGTLRLSEESLTRILLNLVRNAVDAMPESGRIRIAAQRGGGTSFFWVVPDDLPADDAAKNKPETIMLSVEDNGPGIRPDLLERIFEPGFSTRRTLAPWPDAQHQGQGLSAARQLVEAAGGTIRAVGLGRRGARIEIELPLTNVTPSLLSEQGICTWGGTR
jgi:two-component system cell cycle sensor histidine kinase/response regulator CckA